MSRIVQPPILTTDQWGARAAKASPTWVGRPERIIFHHTAGHHREIANPKNESRDEAIRYARDIQAFHMGPERGWNDSGHNFLVCRNGLILVGRHQSYTSVKAGRMVVSAHCPGQNTQPGIEHEHNGDELMTAIQFEMSARLHAWIIDRCRMRGASIIQPHHRYFATSCPGKLDVQLNDFRSRVAHILRDANPGI